MNNNVVVENNLYTMLKKIEEAGCQTIVAKIETKLGLAFFVSQILKDLGYYTNKYCNRTVVIGRKNRKDFKCELSSVDRELSPKEMADFETMSTEMIFGSFGSIRFLGMDIVKK